MRPAGGPGNALAQGLTAEIGGGSSPGRIGEFSDPKRERSGPKGLLWRTRLNEIDQLMLTNP
jgi:hypothetical protein